MTTLSRLILDSKLGWLKLGWLMLIWLITMVAGDCGVRMGYFLVFKNPNHDCLGKIVVMRFRPHPQQPHHYYSYHWIV